MVYKQEYWIVTIFMYHNFDFLTFFDWTIKKSQKVQKTSQMDVFWLFLIAQSKNL